MHFLPHHQKQAIVALVEDGVVALAGDERGRREQRNPRFGVQREQGWSPRLVCLWMLKVGKSDGRK